MLQNIWNRLGYWWCDFAHDGALWPSHGEYRCRQCLRSYSVPWEKEELVASARVRPVALGRTLEV